MFVREKIIQVLYFGVEGGCVHVFVDVVVSISSWIMENFTLEDDDMGLFITQTPKENVEMENLVSFVQDDMDFETNVNDSVMEGQVGNMVYSDISDFEEINDKDESIDQ